MPQGNERSQGAAATELANSRVHAPQLERKAHLLQLQIFSGGGSGGLVFPSLEEFPQFVVIHTAKGFGVVSKAEVDVFSGTLLLFL